MMHSYLDDHTLNDDNTFYEYSSEGFDVISEEQTSAIGFSNLQSEVFFQPKQQVFVVKNYSYHDISHLNYQHDKLLVDCKVSFDKQLDKFLDLFEEQNINKSYLEYIFFTTLKELLSKYPDNIVVELTYDSSIFYTVIKNGLKIFVEFYLTEEEDSDETAMISIVENENEIISFSGNTKNILEKYFNKVETTQAMSTYLFST